MPAGKWLWELSFCEMTIVLRHRPRDCQPEAVARSSGDLALINPFVVKRASPQSMQMVG